MPTPLPWHQIDTVLLDMDGTLIDLHFDSHLWQQLVPERYAARLRRVLAAEKLGDPQNLHGHRTTVEMARWIALWMAFDDIVLVAGKGHEPYQEIHGVKHPFDDTAVARQALEDRR